MSKQITEPGVYKLEDADYFADPVPGGSISPSMAKHLIPGEPFNGCPAIFAHHRDTPQEPKDTFDFGHLAHKLVLGYGSMIEIIDAKDWRTKAAQEARGAAREAGKIPCLKATFDKAQVMADSLRRHPFAGDLFEDGKAERALIWQDEQTGVWLRTKPDWLPNEGRFFADYKTTGDVAPDAFRRSAFNLGYCLQAAFRMEGIRALGLSDKPDDAAFLFVVQDKNPPHLIVVYQPTALEIAWGQVFMRKAIDEFARCQKSGDWSEGYATDVVQGIHPDWAEPRLDRQHSDGLYQISQTHHSPIETAAE